MRKKKDLPLAILKALEPFVRLKGDKFEVVEPKEHFLKVVDKDSDSDFYFSIEKFRKTDKGIFQLLMNKKPRNQNEHGNHQAWVDVVSLKDQFETWVKLLDEYEAVHSFFDDPIAKGFKDEFYAEFELVEDEAETTPLKTSQILLLDNYLDRIDKKLNELVSDQNKDDIKEIQAEIVLLRDNLTIKSKRWIVDNLTKVWAKIAKQGPKFIKEFISDSAKELIIQGVKGLIEIVKESGSGLYP